MTKDGQIFTVKEVKNSVIYSTLFNAEFINAVFQNVGEWSTEFVAKLGEPGNRRYAFFIRSLIGTEVL